MSGWKKHLIFGLTVILIANAILVYFTGGSSKQFILNLKFLPIALLYSILPDIDHPNSKMFLISILVLSILTLFFKNPIYIVVLFSFVLLHFLNKIKHRGRFHTLFAAFIFSLILLVFIDPILALFGFLAYASHLFLDKLKFRRRRK